MSYTGISIREVINKINCPSNGWFLPQVQRQYVWGARHESETYICLLLDSLLRGYPIGGIVLWETGSSVPYREFLKEYSPGKHCKLVDEGRWASHKSLVYDGQQRLQTLYSTLCHNFNDRVLCFDLLFDKDSAEADETGFVFCNRADKLPDNLLRMTQVASIECTEKQRVMLEEQFLSLANGDSDKRLLIRTNISALWSVFVSDEHKSIVYFPVKSKNSREVNEVFKRLNTGGIALTQLELVLSKIKAVYPDFEEKLWELSNAIEQKTGGICFNGSSILQFYHLLIKQTMRIDEDRLNDEDVALFKQAYDDSRGLVEFFESYLKGVLNINNNSIITRWSALLPIAVYLTKRKCNGHEWRIRGISADNLKKIHQYFIKSQFCDWNTQTMVNTFSRMAISAGEYGEDFPIQDIEKTAVEKNRTGEVHEYQLRSQPLLATKVLMTHRSLIFHGNRPQMDHIFPVNLKDMDNEYRATVDVLWNLQPVSGEVNNYKRARHPKEFFTSSDGDKYLDQYDLIPEIESPLWSDSSGFVQYRKEAMLSVFLDRYGIAVILRDEGVEENDEDSRDDLLDA